MRFRSFPSAAEPEKLAGPQSVRSTSTTLQLGKFRSALMEVGLCVIVPSVALLLWALCDQELQMTLLSDSKREVAVALSRITDLVRVWDGTVLSIEDQGRMRFWNMSDCRSVGESQSRLTSVTCGAYEPHDRLVAVGSLTGKLEVWDLDQPDEPIAESMAYHYDVETCRFTPDGRFLCSTGSLGQIMMFDPRTLTLVRTLGIASDALPIRRLEITGDGRYLLAGEKRGCLQVWDLQSYSLVRTVNVLGDGHPTAVGYEHTMIEALLALPGDEEVVVVTRTEGISVWNILTGKCLRRWHGGTAPFHSACLSPDGRRVIAGNAQGEIWMWETATGRCLKSMAVHSTAIRSLACHQDSNVVISGDCHGEICWTRDFVPADLR